MSSKTPHLEICLTSLRSLQAAQLHPGITRIELCSNLSLGGTTPSTGLIRQILRHAKVPVHVLIRPRAGHFFYSEDEVEVMAADIRECAELGAQGVVFGALKRVDGGVDVDWEVCRRLLHAASEGGLVCTFHRAVDEVLRLLPSKLGEGETVERYYLQEIMDFGFDRILTSGGEETAEAGAERLRYLIEDAREGEVRVMVGGGVNGENVGRIWEKCGWQVMEFHASASSVVEENDDPGLFGAQRVEVDAQKVKGLIEAVREIEMTAE